MFLLPPLLLVKLSGGLFKVPQLEWGKTAYFQPLMMPFDRYFYNATLGNYTVARYLESLKEQYSGIDSALLWPTCECWIAHLRAGA